MSIKATSGHDQESLLSSSDPPNQADTDSDKELNALISMFSSAKPLTRETIRPSAAIVLASAGQELQPPARYARRKETTAYIPVMLVSDNQPDRCGYRIP
jgi:hypothetical protein